MGRTTENTSNPPVVYSLPVREGLNQGLIGLQHCLGVKVNSHCSGRSEERKTVMSRRKLGVGLGLKEVGYVSDQRHASQRAGSEQARSEGACTPCPFCQEWRVCGKGGPSCHY